MDSPLCNTTLTGNKLEQFLINSNKIKTDGRRLINVEAENFVCHSFTSNILKIKLKWSQSDHGLPSSVIVKIMNTDRLKNLRGQDATEEEMAKMATDLFTIHDVECDIYDFEDLRKSVPMPLCYAKQKTGDNQPGIMILEDLSVKAGSIPLITLGRGLTVEQLESALDVLTSLHAWSVNTEAHWLQIIPPIHDLPPYYTMKKSFYDNFFKVKEANPNLEAFENFDSKTMEKYFPWDRFMNMFGPDAGQWNMPTVMVHGDYHFGNMLFERKSTDSFGNRLIAVVDWQVAHPGCGLEDLTRLVIMNLSTELRRSQGDRILERYVELFNSKVKNSSQHVELEVAKRTFKEMFAFMAVIWVGWTAVLDQFVETVCSDKKEGVELKNRMTNCFIDSFLDARKMLGI